MGDESMRYKFGFFGMLKTGNMLAGILQNFWMPWLIFYVLYVLVGKFLILIGLDNYLSDDIVLYNLQRIVFIFSISSVIVFCFFRKGVFLNENYLIIARYTITPFNWKWWMKINYSNIEKVNVNYCDISYIDYNVRMVTLGGDRAYNVELTLKNGKKYFFSIEDQEEFCENLNQLIENSKK